MPAQNTNTTLRRIFGTPQRAGRAAFFLRISDPGAKRRLFFRPGAGRFLPHPGAFKPRQILPLSPPEAPPCRTPDAPAGIVIMS